MGFKKTRYFQSQQNSGDVISSTLNVKTMKQKGWKEITLDQYNRIRYS
jgi:hypothetical protein